MPHSILECLYSYGFIDSRILRYFDYRLNMTYLQILDFYTHMLICHVEHIKYSKHLKF